ncbi:MAG: hypothetical protein HYX36_01545 [Rhizobiales bacterium]|nr:hypothetical protein [Hyphomicrobiales bacterium]
MEISLVTIPTIVGATIGMALFGAIIAWIIRKASGIRLVPSYAAGVLIMTFIAPQLAVWGSDGTETYAGQWLIYAVGGLLGFLILILTARRKSPAQ